MSPCSTCLIPGKCCRVFCLNGGKAPVGETTEEAQAWIDQRNTDLPDDILPFRPLYRDTQGNWWCWCPNLNQATGRCTDYENRPATCRDFEPASEILCVLHPEHETLYGAPMTSRNIPPVPGTTTSDITSGNYADTAP